jgi:hypothetical protein
MPQHGTIHNSLYNHEQCTALVSVSRPQGASCLWTQRMGRSVGPLRAAGLVGPFDFAHATFPFECVDAYVLALAAISLTRKSAPNRTAFPGTAARTVASPPRQKN